MAGAVAAGAGELDGNVQTICMCRHVLWADADLQTLRHDPWSALLIQNNICCCCLRGTWGSMMTHSQDWLQGLHMLHLAQILHLDLKPDNVLRDAPDNFRIGDFGLAITRFAKVPLLCMPTG